MITKKRIAAVILAFFFPIFIFVSIIETVVSDKSFYMEQMTLNDVIENTGIYPPDIDPVITQIIAYLNGERDNFDIEARIAPPDAKNVTELQHLFNDKEISHMVDVQILYQNALTVRDWSIIFILISFLYLFKCDKKTILKSLFAGPLIYIVIFSVVGGFFLADFNASFIRFHQIFFTNELWIMDPRTEILINIVPEPFFMAMIRRIIIDIGVFMAGMFMVSGYFIYQNNKRGKNENIKY